MSNPVNYTDNEGSTAEAFQAWTSTMWWLAGADLALPFGDMIYTCGVLILGFHAVSTWQEPSITVGEYADEHIMAYKEHTKGARNSTKGKHQKGQTRKKKDNGGEKGDARRYYLGNKKRMQMVFLTLTTKFEDNYAEQTYAENNTNPFTSTDPYYSMKPDLKYLY